MVYWTPEGRASLHEIADRIRERAGARSVARTTRRIRNRSRTLNTFPESGRVVPEYGRRAVREFIVPPYRVLYRLGPDGVEIVLVLHGRRELPR